MNKEYESLLYDYIWGIFDRSLNDFMFMVEERAAIERRYADKLQTWYTKWASAVNHGMSYFTLWCFLKFNFFQRHIFGGGLRKILSINHQNLYTTLHHPPCFHAGPEFGDVEHVWLSALKEGSKIADIHFKMSSKLGLTHADGVMKNIYKWVL